MSPDLTQPDPPAIVQQAYSQETQEALEREEARYAEGVKGERSGKATRALALQAIYASGLWKATGAQSFEGYAADKWGLGKIYAYYLVAYGTAAQRWLDSGLFTMVNLPSERAWRLLSEYSETQGQLEELERQAVELAGGTFTTAHSAKVLESLGEPQEDEDQTNLSDPEDFEAHDEGEEDEDLEEETGSEQKRPTWEDRVRTRHEELQDIFSGLDKVTLEELEERHDYPFVAIPEQYRRLDARWRDEQAACRRGMEALRRVTNALKAGNDPAAEDLEVIRNA